MLDKEEYISKAFVLADSYYAQMTNWYKNEQDVSIVPESTLEAYLGLLGTLYLTYAYEMESLDKWYAEAFDKEKFEPESRGEKPLSDKSTEQRLSLSPEGRRRMALERRLHAIKFCKESLARAVDARKMGREYAKRV